MAMEGKDAFKTKNKRIQCNEAVTKYVYFARASRCQAEARQAEEGHHTLGRQHRRRMRQRNVLGCSVDQDRGWPGRHSSDQQSAQSTKTQERWAFQVQEVGPAGRMQGALAGSLQGSRQDA